MTQEFKDKVVVITEASELRSGILDGARPTSEDDTATTFELFFDLVYVFAVTQVTGYMVHAHDALGVLQGLLVLALLWWTWCAYAWLGNQARADTGVVRAAMAVAMAALFVVALTIPEAWDDAEGGLDGPLVLVGAYLLVRCVHLTVYAVNALVACALGTALPLFLYYLPGIRQLRTSSIPLLPPTAVGCPVTNPTAPNTRLSIDNTSEELVSGTASSCSLTGKLIHPTS